MSSKKVDLLKSNSSTFQLRRSSSLNKPPSNIRLPKLEQPAKVPQSSLVQQRSNSPVKQQSPSKGSILTNLKNQKLDKLQLLVPQEAFTDAPFNETISAKSWIVCTREPFSVVKQYNSKVRREIASLTKMMTFIATIRILKHFRLDITTTFLRVTLTSIDVVGTLAELQLGQWLNIHDLLMGLMLPSGNDCANVLAENLGALLFFDKMGEKNMLNGLKSIDLSEDYSNIRLYVDTFVRYMNNIAKEFGMKNTLFTNPHGLSIREQFSTAEDMATLSMQLLNMDLAEKFIETRQYEAKIKICNNSQITIRNALWQNTNKLLEKPGYKGIKTGFTTAAGGCLSSYYVHQKDNLIIVVMGSKTQQARFPDTEAVLSYIKHL